MKKFNIGDRVRVIDTFAGLNMKGETGTVIIVGERPIIIGVEFDNAFSAGHTCCGKGKAGRCRFGVSLEELELIKKPFTKSDLQNGDVIKRRNGNVEIVILSLGTLISKDGYMSLNSTNDDLTHHNNEYEWDIVEVRRPKCICECQFCAFEREWGELVYKREDESKYYNGKAVCIKSSLPSDLTVGKVYDFSENEGLGRNNRCGRILNKPLESLEAINAVLTSGIEFIQFVE